MKEFSREMELNQKEKSTLKSVSNYKIVIPIILGIIVIGWLLWKQFDWNELDKIDWTFKVLFWIAIAILIFVVRHFVLSWRLKLLSDKHFSWRKSIELIFIWEFASAVSPTSIGGTAVALFFLAQEKLKSSKAITIVVYSIVLDTAFFIISFILLLTFVGPEIIRPGTYDFSLLDNYAISFFVVLFIMLTYGSVLFYGLFINPNKIKAIICLIASIPWLKRYKKYLRKVGDGMITASYELAHKNWIYHFKAFLATSLAWFMRFALVNAIIIGLISTVKTDFLSQILLYGRNQNMYIQTAFTPTPGASGFSEVMFGGFYSDFVPVGVALLIAIIWRLITYYSYLFAGVIIVPNWIRKIINRRIRAKEDDQKLLPQGNNTKF